MAKQKLVAVKEFCIVHNITREFILDLHKNEIIQLVTVKRTRFIEEKNLPAIERMVRIHRDLDINVEGIQIILHLLSALEKKETELGQLRNQLAFYAFPAAM